MTAITAAVGPHAANKEPDVETVQELLGRHMRWLYPLRPPVVTGKFDADTQAAILRFQETACALKRGDGKVTPGGFTMRQLDRPNIPRPHHKVFNEVCWYHRADDELTLNDYERAAQRIGCKREAIQAVAQVETKRSAWDDLGRPTILYERHYFSRLSGHKFDHTHPDISNRESGGYGRFSDQYPKLWRAAILDESAALQSASWGAFQIMGANFAAAGCASVEEFVNATLESQRRQLECFVAFILADRAMAKALKDLNWATFASHYNGSGYKKNQYDTKMAAAYKALLPHPQPPTPVHRAPAHH